MDRTEQHSTTHEEKSTESSFPFVSGVLALDLVNTEVLARGKPYDLLSSPEEAERWWAEASLHHAERAVVRGEAERPVDAALLEALQRLRTALRHLFMAQISQHPIRASDLDELNHALALGHHLLLQDPAGVLIPAYQTNQPGSGAVVLPIALSALHLMTEGERSRLHRCSNERCSLLFYDTTRSATRHWCSPACMNRARSLEHYRQAKARKGAAPAEP